MSDIIDSPPVPATAPVAIPKSPRAIFAGYTAGQLLVGAIGLAALVWAMWVTRAMLTETPPQRIVKADLSRIVGDYVQAQARSASPPEQVQAQMRTFMASLDSELQRRGADGQIVLVGEAVLSKSVPDITAEVARAVYASGIKTPVPATPSQMGAMMQGQVPTVPTAVPPVSAAQATNPAPANNPFGPMPSPAPAQDAVAPETAAPGASVSTFGGPGGQ